MSRNPPDHCLERALTRRVQNEQTQAGDADGNGKRTNKRRSLTRTHLAASDKNELDEGEQRTDACHGQNRCKAHEEGEAREGLPFSDPSARVLHPIARNFIKSSWRTHGLHFSSARTPSQAYASFLKTLMLLFRYSDVVLTLD